MVGFRDVASATNERTAILAVFPASAVGNTINLILGLQAAEAALLVANGNSFAFDFACRQKVSGMHVNLWIFKQLPVIRPTQLQQPCPWAGGGVTHQEWLLPRVLELTYTDWNLQPFAADCGFDGPPFRWDEDRRFQLRCELDAAFFHLYFGTGEWKQAESEPNADFIRLKEAFPTPRHAVEYVMDTFPIVREQDERKHSRYRTKEQILAVYDALTEAVRTGHPYHSPLDPPPADPRSRHAARDGSLAPGAVRTIADLPATLPSAPFTLRLTEADVGKDQPRDWTCQPLTNGESMPAEGTWVLVRDDGLRRGQARTRIAAGRLAFNPIAGGTEVLLKGAIPPAVLRLTDERTRRVVEVVERWADGLATDDERAAAGTAAHQAWADTSNYYWGRDAAADAAHRALHSTTVAGAELGRGPDGYQPGMQASAVASSVLIQTASAVESDYQNSPERPAQAALIRCLAGNPFRPTAFDPAWRTATVVALAEGIYEERAFDRMPILADALQDAGCDNPEILQHCRGGGPHCRGCWLIDAVLGKE